MEYIILVISIICLVCTIVILILTFKNKNNDSQLSESELKKIRESVNESVNQLSVSVSNLIAEKNSSLMSDLNKRVNDMTLKIDSLEHKFDLEVEKNNTAKENLNKKLNDFNSEQRTSFNDFKLTYSETAVKTKEELIEKLSQEIKGFNETVKETLNNFNNSIKEKLDDFKQNTNESIKGLNETVNKTLSDIRKDNNEKLDKINQSVNEKLEETLSKKIEDSFKAVIEGIGSVNKAVGEIKNLASDVSNIKNVLTNVKTKGITGEVILGNIIKEFLTSGQFEENVITKKGSRDRVEYAIIIPGTKDDKIYLPIDSKFPYEPYNKILNGQTKEEVEAARKELRSNLLKYAQDVHDKYIDVPNTTDFAVIFLPLEGLYLECIQMNLFEEIQEKYKVNLTGPSTLSAFISSLNMGFKSLLIEKKSAEVFKLLGAVKTEFNKFAEALDKTQKKVNQAADELENLVGTRTRQMNKQLSSIEALGEVETNKVLNIENSKE